MKNMKRLFALVLALMLVLSSVPAVFAEESNEENVVGDVAEKTSQPVSGSEAIGGASEPVWNERLGEKPESFEKTASTMQSAGENEVKNALSIYDDTPVSELLAYLRGQLKARNASFSFTYYTSSEYDYDAFCASWIPRMFEHTGVSTEGDYLQWHWRTWKWSDSGKRNQYVTYTYQFTYLTTASQETATTTAVNNLLKQLNLSGKTDYQKVCAIYDWMCDNITYDYDGLEMGIDASPTTWTAYKGIVKGTCVCQGYASLFYRLALESGLSARVITGDGGGPHAWNIVKLGSKYYNLDATWDAGYSNYSWFLLGSVNFTDHYRDAEYDTSDFHSDYPTSTTDYVPGQAVPGDMDGNGILDTDDAVYLLLHVLFGEEDYPLAV